MFLWVPPWLLDRLRHSRPGECFWDPSLNPELVYIVGVLGHHGSFCVMVFCYTRVFMFMRKRSKTIDTSRQHRDTALASSSHKAVTEDDVSKAQATPSFMTGHSSIQHETEHGSIKHLRVPEVGTSRTLQNRHGTSDSRFARERRVFVTLTYIIIGYCILWLPFHIIFDITIYKPDYVPEKLWNVAFWMTYFNSTVNPFLYNFSCPEFKRVFRNILTRKYCWLCAPFHGID